MTFQLFISVDVPVEVKGGVVKDEDNDKLLPEKLSDEDDFPPTILERIRDLFPCLRHCMYN